METGIGALDAIDSKVYLNKKFLEKIKHIKPIDSETLLEDSKYEYLREVFLDPVVEKEDDARKIILYKIPLLLDKENVLITGLKLVYLPFWEIKFNENKKTKTFFVSALDIDDIKNQLDVYLKSKIKKIEKTKSDLFLESFDYFKDWKSFVKEFKESMVFLYNYLLKNYPIVFYFILAILIFLLLKIIF